VFPRREGGLEQSDGQEVVADEVVVINVKLGRTVVGAHLEAVIIIGDRGAGHVTLQRGCVKVVCHDATAEDVVYGHPRDIDCEVRIPRHSRL
jgi:hypothetical protein